MVKAITTRNGQIKTIDLATATYADFFGIERSTQSVQLLYNRVGFMRACVEKRATAISLLPYTIYAQGSDKPIYRQDDTNFPNAVKWIQDISMLIRLFDMSLVLADGAFCIKEQQGTTITGLHYCNPLSVNLIQGKDFSITGIQHTHKSGSITYALEDVINIYQPSPYKEIGGIDSVLTSLGVSASGAASVIYNLTDFLAKYTKGGMIKPTFLSVDTGNGTIIPKEEKERIKSLWRRIWGSRFTSGTTEILSTAVKPVTVGEGIADLKGTNLTPEQKQDIAAAFGVPASLVLPNAANYATAEKDEENFYELTVFPAALFLQKELNKQLLAQVGLEIEFDFDKTPVRANRFLKRAQGLQMLVGGAPILTQNEAREMLNLDALPEIQQPVNDPNPTDPVVKSELRNWKRVAASGRDFKTAYIPDEIAVVIRERLTAKMPIEKAFEPPFEVF